MQNIQFHEVANIFPLIHGKEFVDLKADIKKNGVHEPIVMYEGQILDGRNRFRACQEVGVQPEFVEYGGSDPVSYVLSLNLHRRHLNESQRADVAAQIETLGQGHHGKDASLHVSRKEASEKLNVSERSVASAKKVRTNGVVELINAVQSGSVSVSAAADVATLPEEDQQEITVKGEREILNAAKEIRAKKASKRRKERVEKIVNISEGNIELKTDKKYPVIYADPPWRYEDGTIRDCDQIENHYPTMSIDEICELELPAAKDAILFMWTTAPKLYESMKVLDAWGFSYRSCGIWDKQKMGLGYYFRVQHEILMIATKGDIPVPEVANRPRSIVSIARTKHSAKPHEFAEIIENMYPEFSKIELFCRSPRDGWDVWGNQSESA